jgi:hypothetical protein
VRSKPAREIRTSRRGFTRQPNSDLAARAYWYALNFALTGFLTHDQIAFRPIAKSKLPSSKLTVSEELRRCELGDGVRFHDAAGFSSRLESRPLNAPIVYHLPLPGVVGWLDVAASSQANWRRNSSMPRRKTPAPPIKI